MALSLWRKSLSRSRGLFDRIASLLGGDQLDDSQLELLETLLIESDVGMESALSIMDEIRERMGRENVQLDVKTLLKEKLIALLRKPAEPPSWSEVPHVILVVGVNGTGKTTTIGKLAHYYREQNKKVLLAAADTFRAAAGDQLHIWAKKAGAEIVRQCMGGDPAAVAFDAVNAAKARSVDVLIIDTAGRLHNRVNLMEELKKIPRVLKKLIPSAPHEVLLVLDATTGQNGLVQAEFFTKAVGVTGIVLAKLEGTARGGIVVAIQQKLGIPVQWVGVGEKLPDLLPFDAGAFVDGWFSAIEEN